MRQTKVLYPSKNIGEDFITTICENIDFQTDLYNLRKKWKIDVPEEIHLSENQYISTKQNKLSKNKKFIADIRALQKKWDLGEEWFLFIEEYIFLDSFTYIKSSNFFIEKRTGSDSDSITGKPAYFLRIFPETTEKDIESIWSEVNIYLNGKKTKSKRRKPSIKHVRDKEIYKLANAGFCIEEIQKFFFDKYNKRLQDDQIKTAESRYRKTHGIKESNKLGYRKNGADLTPNQKLTALWPTD